ncbi:MAG TPA: PucR family transcriptional regulator [Candidatus Limnocylindria bacterium]|nr:PucR family transcriptional regulator [Candidatus Limnocylindria bacterium]
MPSLPVPSVRSVAGLPGLGIKVRCGDLRAADGSDRPVRWVAVSELEDPRSFLEGGELLLSTGMRLPGDDVAALEAYVDRLVEAGVAAYGLGTGLTHAEVPASLLRAADERGLVVLEVPEETPFIAVSKAVSAMVAAQDYEATTRAFETQRDLTRAALGSDAVPALASRLARALGAWVLVLDPAGRVLASSPEADDTQVVALRTEVDLLRAQGLLSSSALDVGSARVVLHPLGARGTVRGFLAVGRDRAFDRTDQSLVAVAVSLVSLAVERGGADDAAEGRVVEAALRMLLTGVASDDLPLDLLGWAWLRSEAFCVVRVPVRLDEARALVEAAARGARDQAAVRLDDEVVLLLPDTPADRAAAASAVGDRRAGGSGRTSLSGVADAWRDAGRALGMARAPGVVWHDDVGNEGLLGVIDPGAGRVFADSLLAPLDATGGKADLLASTRAWLAHHGQWDVAAHELGVHRHTLRYRMRRVEELLGRSLDDADLRAELWFALELRAHQSG